MNGRNPYKIYKYENLEEAIHLLKNSYTPKEGETGEMQAKILEFVLSEDPQIELAHEISKGLELESWFVNLLEVGHDIMKTFSIYKTREIKYKHQIKSILSENQKNNLEKEEKELEKANKYKHMFYNYIIHEFPSHPWSVQSRISVRF